GAPRVRPRGGGGRRGGAPRAGAGRGRARPERGEVPVMRNVLITGGSSGIGRACVARFVAAGDQVWFTYRSGRERADRIVAEHAAAGGQVAAFELDQGDWASHRRLADQLPGPVDVLVNNAAVRAPAVRPDV